jgi:hypothetical protein
VCNKEEGIGVEDFVVEFLGEVAFAPYYFSVIPIIFTWRNGILVHF